MAGGTGAVAASAAATKLQVVYGRRDAGERIAFHLDEHQGRGEERMRRAAREREGEFVKTDRL